jgi:hypothetical protein
VLGGGHEATLDRAVLLCEAFAELDELEARLVGKANARAAERAAPHTEVRVRVRVTLGLPKPTLT